MNNPNPQIFDKALWRLKNNRAAINFADHNFLHEWTDTQVSSRLDLVKKEFGCGLYSGHTPQNFSHHPKIKTLHHLCAANNFNAQIIADEEFLPIGNDCLDIFISTLSLHHSNDLLGALIQAKMALKPDGLFIGTLFGGETLYELRQVLQQTEMGIYGGLSPRVAPFADIKTLGSLMQRAHYALPVIDSEKVIVEYNSLTKLFHDLRFMGEGNHLFDRNRQPVGKKFWRRAEEIYRDGFGTEDNRFIATFEIIFLLGWKPHDSQQQPMKPGSAKNRLADSLNATEEKL